MKKLLTKIKTIMTLLKFKKDIQPVGTGDFYHDLIDGGYLEPEKFLEGDDANKVREAIELIRQYQNEGITLGLFEEM